MASVEPWLESVLGAIGLAFEPTDDGGVKVEIPTSAERTQVVFIDPAVLGWPECRFRRIYSCAYTGREDLPRRVVDSLLEQSRDLPFGKWGTLQDGGELMLIFEALLPASVPPEVLAEVISMVAAIADERESQLSERDGL